MAAACACCVNHVHCCSCVFNKEQTWSKSLRNFPKCSPTKWSSWLEQGGKKNAGEKSYKFFREGYVYDVYACQQLEDFHVKARCYRSLRKSEEPHFLAVIFRESDGRAEVFKAHCSCKGGSGGHCNHVFALLFQLNDYYSGFHRKARVLKWERFFFLSVLVETAMSPSPSDAVSVASSSVLL